MQEICSEGKVIANGVSLRRLRLGMAQINTTVGDFKGDTEKILTAISTGKARGVDVITFRELAVCGYLPEDFLFKPKFIDENLRSLDRVIEDSPRITVMVGFVDARGDIYWRESTLLLEEQRWQAPNVVVSETSSNGSKSPLEPRQAEVKGIPGEIYDAFVLGTRDYIHKNNIQSEVIGLSGGIDSSRNKRRQPQLGVKITPRVFRRDSRLPITNRFKGC